MSLEGCGTYVPERTQQFAILKARERLARPAEPDMRSEGRPDGVFTVPGSIRSWN